MPVGIEYLLVFLGMALGIIGFIVLVVALVRRRRSLGMVALSFLVIAAILVGRLGYAEFWDVDTCLDSGGAYNYDAETCEYG